ncbi:MAG TPA: DUF4097 family beta strand repeat-containing protein [Candidatus Baltobacteraceae bacterium]|nr:DUF4097 family beta strand repeat-containing protein [Candidatus Baltobacteraceae bacterium]
MKKPRRFLTIYAALTAFALLPLGGCIGAVFGDEVSADYHTSFNRAPATIEVHNPVGQITIDAWNKPGVQIDASKRGNTLDDVHAITITVTHSGSTLVIASDLGSNAGGRKVDYTIHAPADTNLNLDESVGAIKSSGFAANLDASTSTGAMEVSMASAGSSQHIKLDVSVGAIRLNLPRNTDAAVTASTSVGAIKSDFPLSITRSTVGSNAQGTIGKGTASIDLTIATGAIAIDRE